MTCGDKLGCFASLCPEGGGVLLIGLEVGEGWKNLPQLAADPKKERAACLRLEARQEKTATL